MAERLSDEIRDKIMHLFLQDNLAPKTIAIRLGIGSTSVYRLIRDSGISLRAYNEKTKRHPKRRFNPEQAQQIADRYAAGESAETLRKEHGCCLQTIYDILNRFDVPRHGRGAPPRLFSQDDIDNIIRLYIEERKPQEVIAKHYKCSQTAISNVLRENGIRRRSFIGKGVHVDRNGYRRLHRKLIPEQYRSMCHSNGYALEHRIVMAKSLGRILASHETVHHIDGDRSNNNLENLQLRSGKHGKGVKLRCCDCGSRNIVSEKIG